MSDATITYLVLAAVVVVFVWGRVPTAIAAIGVALALWATGVLDLEQALAGFGDPTVIFIASLFVVSEALDATGVTAWAGQRLIASAGESRTRLIVADDGARRAADGADQRQRRRRGARARRRRDGAAARAAAVAAAAAARLRRTRGLAARAHRDAGQRDRLRRGRRRRRRARSASSSSRSSGCRSCSGRSPSSALLGERLLPSRTARTIGRDFSGHARTLVAAVRARAPAGRRSSRAAPASPRS